MFTVCIETFKDIQYQRTQMYKFSDADTDLAFDLQIGPVGDQIWGYYSRLQHLPIHFMNTWDEMMITEFFMIPTHLFHPKDGPLQTKYLKLRKVSNFIDYKRTHLLVEERARQHELQAAIEQPWRLDKIPQRQPRGRGRH